MKSRSSAEDELASWQWEIGAEEILAYSSEQRHDSLALIQIAVLAVQLAEVHDVQVKEVLWHKHHLSGMDIHELVSFIPITSCFTTSTVAIIVFLGSFMRI